MKKHKPDIALIRKYLNGELSPREMYELERQAQDDPMLMDVMMGMESGDADAHQANLSEIRRWLQQRAQPGKTKRLAVWRPWVAAASVMLLLAIGGLWIVRDKPVENQLARQVAEPPIQEMPPLANRDATEEATQAAEPIVDERRIASVSAPSPPVLQPAIPELDTAATRLAALADRTDTSRVDHLSDSIESLQLLAYQQTDDKLAAKALTAEQAAAPQPATITLSERAAGVSTRGQPQRAATEETADEHMLDEVVVASGVQRKKAVVPTKATPMVGWEHYNRYLGEHALADDNKKGTVTLAFTVDSLGNPTDIRVVKGLTDILNAKAIQLVRDGSKWQQGSDAEQEVRLKIRFR